MAADTRPSLAGDVAVVFWYAERRIHDGGGFNGGVRGRAGNFKYAFGSGGGFFEPSEREGLARPASPVVENTYPPRASIVDRSSSS